MNQPNCERASRATRDRAKCGRLEANKDAEGPPTMLKDAKRAP
jgi:hypothetical protein